MKRLYILCLFFLLTQSYLGFAQNPPTIKAFSVVDSPMKRWDKTLGGAQSDYGLCIESADNDTYVLAGTSRSDISGNKESPNKGEEDFWIVKLNHNGDKVWDKSYGGSSYDYLRTIVKCVDGGFIIGGESASPQDGDKSQPNHPFPNGIPSPDYWIVKIDGNGNKQWDKRYGGNGFEYLRHIIQTSDGGYLLAGESDSNDGGEKTENLRYGRDAWVVRIDANGNKLWDKTLGGSKQESAWSVLELTDGNILVACGTTEGADGGDITATDRGGEDVWLVKLSSGGSIMWDKKYGTSGSERFPSMVETYDGNVFLSALINGPQNGDASSAQIGVDDFWLLKIDYNGNKIWDRRFGAYGSEGIPTLYKTFDKKYLIAGPSTSNAGNDISDLPHSNSDIWVLKIDDNGNKYWNERFGCDNLYSWGSNILKPTPDLGYIFIGSGGYLSGDKTENSYGEGDMWIYKAGVNNFMNPLCTQPNRELAFVASGCNGTINWSNSNTGEGLYLGFVNESIVVSATCTENQQKSSATSFRVNVALYQHYITETFQTDNKIFNAMTTIEANNLIGAPVDVKYIAGNSIQLNPGFKAESGSIFSAVIKSCFD
jgi:hypothetical protein